MSKLWLPPQAKEKPLELPRNRSMELYDEQHKCCPKCGGESYETTCIGYWGAYNPNRIRCDCGWVGIGHELVPAEPGFDPIAMGA